MWCPKGVIVLVPVRSRCSVSCSVQGLPYGEAPMHLSGCTEWSEIHGSWRSACTKWLLNQRPSPEAVLCLLWSIFWSNADMHGRETSLPSSRKGILCCFSPFDSFTLLAQTVESVWILCAEMDWLVSLTIYLNPCRKYFYFVHLFIHDLCLF